LAFCFPFKDKELFWGHRKRRRESLIERVTTPLHLSTTRAISSAFSLLNLVTGGGSTMGSELVTNKITRLVTMTGSTATGQEIFRKCAQRLIAVRLELGGKAPFILLEDGGVDKAVEAAMLSRYLNCGQVCTCSERFYIHDTVYDQFVEKYVAASSKLKLGDPLLAATQTLVPRSAATNWNRWKRWCR
jgi:acyl-CoA reductase-like NAD-dependent aldehyde dehydrogenase